MTKSLKVFLILLTLASCVSCAGSKEFGPYKGKVVDKETKAPIEGAVVFLRFFVLGSSIGGAVSYYADAVEVLTDSKGEFIIPKSKLRSYKPFREWKPHGHVIIFKPGYGVYPWHKKSKATPRIKPDWTLPIDSYIKIELPKLKNIEERRRNLSYAEAYNPMKIPVKKQKEILRLTNSESEKLGLGKTDPSKWR